MRCHVEKAVHIGDHALDDIAGAQQAGLRAVWFNPKRIAWAHDYQPDAEIQRLADLPKLLLAWRDN